MSQAELLRDPVLARDGFRCRYCGADLLATLESFVTFCRDHVTPRSAGGATHDSNLVTSCAACDRLKSGRPAASVVTIANDLNGTVRQFRLPVSPEEAMECCVYLSRLHEFVRFHELCESRESVLGASIVRRERESEITVHLHTSGDQHAAQELLSSVEAGDWDWEEMV